MLIDAIAVCAVGIIVILLLIGGYLLPVMLTIGVLVAVVGRNGEDDNHFARRLWPAGTPASATTGDA